MLSPLGGSSGGSGIVAPPAALSDANHWWYDATDLATITKDGSNFVSAWNAKGGAASGKNFGQVTGTNQPNWSLDGITYDGIDNCMATPLFTFNQPAFFYITVKVITATGVDYFIGGTDFNTCESIISPNILILKQISQFQQTGFSTGVWRVVRMLYNGAASKIILGNGTPVIGTVGSNGFGRIWIGSYEGVPTIEACNVIVKDIVCSNVIDSESNETAIYNWLESRKPAA